MIGTDASEPTSDSKSQADREAPTDATSSLLSLANDGSEDEAVGTNASLTSTDAPGVAADSVVVVETVSVANVVLPEADVVIETAEATVVVEDSEMASSSSIGVAYRSRLPSSAGSESRDFLRF